MQTPLPDTPPQPPMNRRRWLAWTLASVALGASGVAAWRQFGPRQAPVPTSINKVPERWWTHAFAQPGQDSTRTLQSFRGQPLLINLWATWCPPCIEEMPLLDAFYRQNAAKGWQTVGIAVDKPEAVERFLQRTPVQFPVLLAGNRLGMELAADLGNTARGLPFSLLLDARGQPLEAHTGQLDLPRLLKWHQRAFSRNTHS